jgi:DEAD/DEAH box helicase domain-containing protein
VPWHPAAANAFRSAWMPAPPPESDAAIVRQRGSEISSSLTTLVRQLCAKPTAWRDMTRAWPGHVQCERCLVGRVDSSAARRRYPRRMALGALLWDDLLASEEVAHHAEEPARPARLAPLPADLDPRVAAALARQGVTQLYEHQADAWSAAQRNEHVIVTTGTASGKTLAFNLPVLDAIVREPKNRALYLYPTKALAQDQARALAAHAVPKLRPAIYDGDTEAERRWQIRKWANAILTNPDMLHVGVLPHHDRWGDVLANLRYVIVDEAHVYRGVFGSHVANVLRRLRRLACAYGSEPQFLLASATIANPGELAQSLLGLAVTVVGDDAAPRAERAIVLWNPPLLDEELGQRASALGDGAKLLADLVSRGLRTLCFAKSRKAAELIHRFAIDRLGREYRDRLSPYRAGYTAAQRREIERRLVAGDLLGVSATDALELGIDVGLLDAVISVGFPGTVASLRQQWGRAGRRGRGLALLVASEDALDQYFMREPEALLGRRVEAAILDHANPRVLDGHVLSAAFEGPLGDADRDTLGDEALERAPLLPELKRTPKGFVWAGRDYPAARIALRSASPDAFTVIDAETGSLLGLVERERACSTVHEGAIYLHLGESYRVRLLDLETRTALVDPFAGDYYTQAKKETTTAIEEPLRVERRLGLELSFGRVSVSEQVVGYQRRSTRDGSTLDLTVLDLPETTFETEAVWYVPEPEQLEGLDRMPLLLSTLHAAEHSLIALLPLWAMCDRWDIGGLSTNLHFQTGRPTVFVYDGHPGGVGIAERGFEAFEGWVEDTAKMLAGCPCDHGCPSCVQSPKCGNLNELLDKAGALELLRRLLAV